MGCDIHAYIEVRIRGRWVCHSQPRIRRAYGIFGKLAGVRDCGPAIVEPRGLPPDVSEIVAIEYAHDQADAHSESWLGPEELKQFVAWLAAEEGTTYASDWQRQQLGYITGNSPMYLPGDGYPRQYEAMRLVFWFMG